MKRHLLRTYDIWALLVALSVFLVVLATLPAHAGECGDRCRIIRQLDRQFSEHRRHTGMMRKSGIMEIYVSKKKGTWTVLLTTPLGSTCIVAAGEMWEDIPPFIEPAL